jgi:hypothetical protein
LNIERQLEIRKPLDDLEARTVQLMLERPNDYSEGLVHALRYVLSFARLTLVRAEDGRDVDLADFLAPHRWRVLEALRPHLEADDASLWPAVRSLPSLVEGTRIQRRRVLENFDLDRDSLEAEVTQRPLVVASGGGGGGGYGYAGAFQALDHWGLQPELLGGTSIGGLLSLFRARRRVFDWAALVAAARRLSWNTVFRALDMESRYGIPATLRLYLRTALAELFQSKEPGRSMLFEELEIPTLVVATGLGVEALKHDLAYYEHFLDDERRPGRLHRASKVRRALRMASIFREFLATPDALREVVFGADELTMKADVLDAAGFSAAIPGFIHYDVLREDRHMKHLLDQLYGEYGITRLTEGGIVNNLPARPVYHEVMKGRITRRNAFVLAMDCFAPTPGSLLWLPVQQVVRANVQANCRYANHYFPLTRRMSPMHLVPSVDQLMEAMRWTREELDEQMPFVHAMCETLQVLPESPRHLRRSGRRRTRRAGTS